MALWIRDGLEFYNTTSDGALGSAGYGIWNTASNNLALSTTTRFGVGRSGQCGGSGAITYLASATSAFTNSATVFIGVAYLNSTALTGSTKVVGFELLDGASVQCTVSFGTDGNIYLTSAGIGGTLQATYSAAFLANQWNQFQFKIIINNTTGEFHVRKNGNTADDFSATGLNTRGGTANNQANGVAFVSSTTAGQVRYIDDLAVWDNSGSAPWNDWVGDFRAVQLMANSDNSVQFSQTNGGSTTFGSTTNTSSRSRAANTIFFMPFTPTCGGTLGALSVTLAAGLTGHMKCALYDSNGDNTSWDSLPTSFNQPGSLLYETNEVTNPVSGANSFTWVSTPTVANGHKYYIAIWTDAAATINDNNSSVAGKWSYALTYGSFPTDMSNLGSTLSTQTMTASATITATNSGMVSDYTEDGATTYVNDSVVGHTDLYGVQPLPVTPASVLGVDLVGMCAKSDAGTRTISYLIKSSTTTVTETAIAPNTTFNYNRYQQDTDPATGSAWTATAVNNMLIGQTIVS